MKTQFKTPVLGAAACQMTTNLSNCSHNITVLNEISLLDTVNRRRATILNLKLHRCYKSNLSIEVRKTTAIDMKLYRRRRFVSNKN